jgi:hypothetical protein
MAWNEELTKRFGECCIECGQAFEAAEERKELAFGHAVHRACYWQLLEKVERGALGDSGEETEPGFVDRQRARFLKREVDQEREQLAFKRTAALFGVDTAERIERLLCEQKKINTKNSTA